MVCTHNGLTTTGASREVEDDEDAVKESEGVEGTVDFDRTAAEGGRGSEIWRQTGAAPLLGTRTVLHVVTRHEYEAGSSQQRMP